MNIVLVGNGILSLTTAFRLLNKCADADRIYIVGPKSRPGSATLAAAAMLNSFAEIERDGLNADVDRLRFEMSHLATKMWPAFESEIIEQSKEYSPDGCPRLFDFGGGSFTRGTYVLNNTAADSLDDDNFAAIESALTDFNEPFEVVDPKDIPGYFPSERQRARRALLVHGEGWINPRLMLEKLELVLERDSRVIFADSEAVSFDSGIDGNLTAVNLENGSVIKGDRFLVAAGASSGDLLARSKIEIGMQKLFFGVGVSIEIMNRGMPQENCIRTPNRGLACGIYAVPYFQEMGSQNDHIILGATNYVSAVPEWHARMGSTEALMRAGIDQINVNFYRALIIRTNVGWRPTSQDTYPLIGGCSVENLFIATGTKRDGFHLSPLISETVSSLIMGQRIDDRWETFRPSRGLIRSLTREQAILKGVSHQMSAAYQHGFVPSNIRMHEQYAASIKSDLERLHDEVGAYDWGIPPEMMEMYRFKHATL
jgi:glycine oxidase